MATLGALKQKSLNVEGRRTLSDAVFDFLLEAIVKVEVEPGAPLQKDEIAAELGVSRTPVGDAFNRLSALGLVTVIPQVSSFVSRISAQAVLESSFLRSATEAEVVSTLASRGNRAEVGELRKRLADQARFVAIGDVDGFHASDEAFHRQMMELAGFPGLWDQIAAARLHLIRIRRLGLPRPGRLEISHAEHTNVVDEIAARRPRSAAKAIAAHIRYSEGDLRRLEKESPQYFV